MCAAYRRILGGKSAPHLRFGVPARRVDDKANSISDESTVNGQLPAGYSNGITATGIPDPPDFSVDMRANMELLSQVDTGIAAHLLNILASTSGDMVTDSMQRQVEELHRQLAGAQADGLPVGIFPFDASGKTFLTTAGTSMIQTSFRPDQQFLNHYSPVPPNR
jgi:hypothetical protein